MYSKFSFFLFSIYLPFLNRLFLLIITNFKELFNRLLNIPIKYLNINHHFFIFIKHSTNQFLLCCLIIVYMN